MEFGLQISHASCSKAKAIYTFHASFLKTLDYATPVTQFSLLEWDHILTPALGRTLQRAGTTRNAPWIPLFAPGLFQGLGWRHPYYTQGLCHIQTLLQASISCSQTGALLRHTAEAFWVKLGVPFSLGCTSYKRYSSYVPRSWYKSTWEFVDDMTFRFIRILVRRITS